MSTARRARRWLLGVVVFALSLELLWLLIVGIINTGYPTNFLNDAQDDVDLHHGFVWSWFPGLISAKDLEVIVHDSHVVLRLRVDESETWFSPMALFRRELRLFDGHSKGLSMEVRLHHPALPSDGPPNLDRLWQVELRNMVTEDVRELAFEEVSFHGQARLHGGFFLFPTQRLSIATSTVIIDRGVLIKGDAQFVAQDIKGRIVGELDEVFIPEVEGNEMLRAVSTKTEVTARVTSPKFLNRYLRDTEWVRLERGGGDFAATVAIDHGRIQGGTKVSLTSTNLMARVLDEVAVGSGSAVFNVVGKKKPTGRLRVVLNKFEGRKMNAKPDEKPYVRGRDLKVDITTRALDLVNPFTRLDTKVDVPSAVVPDMRVFKERIPASAGLAIQSGSATVSVALHVTADDELKDGVFFLSARRVKVGFRTLKLGGDLDIDSYFSAKDLKKPHIELAGTHVQVRDASVIDSGRTDSRNWWGSLVFDHATLSPRDGGPPDVDAVIRSRFADMRPLIAVYAAEKSLPGWVKDVLAMNDARGRLHLMVTEERIGVRDFDLRSGQVEIRARARIAGDAVCAASILTYSGLAVAMIVANQESNVELWSPTSKYQTRANDIARDLDREARVPTAGQTGTGTIAP